MSSAQPLLDGWPVAATLALALAGDRVRCGRRRSALNGALHELRRPLQILALSAAAPATPTGEGASPLELTWLALADLDRHINGGSGPFRPRLIRCRDLIDAAAERWRLAADLAGGAIRVSGPGHGALALADPGRLGQAIDNLVANALEHGDPNVTLGASVRGPRVRLTVAGSRASHPLSAAERVDVGALRSRLAGRRRRGHGLRAASEITALHGGRLLLSRSEQGTVATLDLPLAGTALAAA